MTLTPEHNADPAARAHPDDIHYHRIRVLSGAGRKVADRVASAVTRTRIWEPGHHVYRAGDDVRSLYVVCSGTVKNYLTSEDGGEQVLGFFLPGEILGLEAVKSRCHGCSAVVLETSSISELSLSRLETSAKNLDEPCDPLTELCSSAVARDYAALWILSKKGADQRLAGFLLNLSERYARRGFSACEYHLCMSRRDIGDYLGLALGTVSRLLSAFEAKGLLAVRRRHIRLLRINGLRALAGTCPWPTSIPQSH